MSKKYSEDDIRKGFRNLAKLKQKTVKLEKEVDELKHEIATYQAKEVGQHMVKMGFNNNEAHAAISMLKRMIPSNWFARRFRPVFQNNTSWFVHQNGRSKITVSTLPLSSQTVSKPDQIYNLEVSLKNLYP